MCIRDRYDIFVKQGIVKLSGENHVDYRDVYEWFSMLRDQYGICLLYTSVKCIASDCVEERAFDEGNKNDFAASSLRAYLNGEFLRRLIKSGAPDVPS